MPEPILSAVTFDAGNTLLHSDPSPSAVYAEHLSRYGPEVTEDDVGPAFRQTWTELQHRNQPGEDRYGSVAGGDRAWWGAFVRHVLERLNHPAPWEPLLDELYDAFSRPEIWKTYPDTVPTLDELARMGTPMAVISNWDRRLPHILDGLGLTPFFDTVTVSSLEGIEKPSPEIFHRTLARLGMTPERVLHVGDSPHDDYQGAAAAGLTPRLLDRHDLFAGDSYQRIESLSEVLDLVG